MTEWIVTSSVLIVVVAALRCLLRGRISLRLQYALWAVVLLRLLLPVQLGHSSLSVLNAVKENRELQLTVSRPLFYLGETPDLAMPEPEPDPNLSTEEVTQQLELQYYEELAQHATPVSPAAVLRTVWIIGMAVTAAWLLAANLRFARMLRRSRRLTDQTCGKLAVYASPLVETPCLFGLFRPNLYVTEEVLQDETALRHALLHEQTHYRHGDHIWSVLRGVCLVLHWYNPLIWLAAALSRRDAELACDEGTLRRLGEDERTAYGETLIRLTCGHRRGELLLTSTAMTGSKRSLRERITLIARKPKMAVYTLIAAVLVVAIASGCTFTGGEQKNADPIPITVADGLQHPIRYRLQQIIEDYIRTQAAQIGTQMGDPNFITSAEITSHDPAGSGTFGNPVNIWVTSFDYRLLPKETGKTGNEVGSMVYAEEDGRIWLKEKRTEGTLYLATEYWPASATHTLLGVFSMDDMNAHGDHNAGIYAYRLYQSRSPSGESYAVPISEPLSPLYSDALVSAVKEYVNEHASRLLKASDDPELITLALINEIKVGSRIPDALRPVSITYTFFTQKDTRLLAANSDPSVAENWPYPSLPTRLYMPSAAGSQTPPPRFTATILLPAERLSASDLTPVAVYTDIGRNPEPVILAAQEYVVQQIQAVNDLTGNAGFVTGGEICNIEAITTGSVTETMGINLYHLDYRLHLQGSDTRYTDLNNMSYVEEEGTRYLREDDSRGTPILAMEYRLQDGGGRTWTRLGILYTGDVATQYGGDYNRAAVEFYESVRDTVH